MAKLQTELVTGLITSKTNLDRLLASLETRGYAKEDVTVVMSDRERGYFLDNTAAVNRGAGLGALGGGILGGLLGAALVLPGGPIVEGIALGLLAGGTFGATTGTLVSTMRAAGVPDAHIGKYRDAINEQGHILVMVHVPAGKHVSEIRSLFEQFGMTHIEVNG